MARSEHPVLGWVLVGLAVFASAAGQLCMRRGMIEVGPIESGEGLWQAWSILMASPSLAGWVALGVLTYAVGATVWLQVLARTHLSAAFPMLSLGYVVVYIGAALWPVLDEPVSWLRSFGILMIVAGVSVVAQSNRGA